MDIGLRRKIIRLMEREVIPAIGCTEPISVALAVAKVKELLGVVPDFIDVQLSANVLKNAMGVGIPGTGMYGLPIAIAMGAIAGKSEYGLEVLKDSNPELLELGKIFIQDKKLKVSLKEDCSEKLYIEVTGQADEHTARAIISGEHTRFVLWEKDAELLFDSNQEASTFGGTPENHPETQSLSNSSSGSTEENEPELSFDSVCDFACTTPIDDLRFILKTVEINKAAAAESLKGTYGHGVAQTLSSGLMGNNVYTHMLSYTAAACDARMAGAMIPVMSNSGSGNQGITATLPVSVFAEETGKSEDDLIRALTLSHLMTIYIKQSLGRLSGLCGAVVAATGSSCGITYLMGGSREQLGYAIKNMIGNITGMICDGAKPSCTLKVSNGVSTAMLSAMMAIDNKVVTAVEGIADEEVDKTIANLTKIGRFGMLETDRMILEIMTSK
ncbi:MAG: L-serine ammonia-lyase, iron-sulfur-dependent, subunit alpha [Paludibacter sp.]|nr:L-serine ammonia-lyase, iron-sulfur-dependent, subunit alpha [Paludibacter sp.]